MIDTAFLHGVSAACSLVASVMFLKSFRETNDRIFVWFAWAFAMFAVNWTLISLLDPPDDRRHLLYVIRLAGFMLILGGVASRHWARTRVR